jgi:hypothetical protein
MNKNWSTKPLWLACMLALTPSANAETLPQSKADVAAESNREDAKPDSGRMLSTVVVRGEPDTPFVESAKRQPRTETTINQQGIANTARAGQTSIYQALDMASGVSLESLDAHGVARMSPGGTMRIRGAPTTCRSPSRGSRFLRHRVSDRAKPPSMPKILAVFA